MCTAPRDTKPTESMGPEGVPCTVRASNPRVVSCSTPKTSVTSQSRQQLPKTALGPAENGQMKGNDGYSARAARLPRAGGPSTAL